MPETRLIRINRDLWLKLQKAVADYDFGIKDLVEWILRDVDVDEYAQKLALKVESEAETAEEAEREDERKAEEEETSTDEELAESADDEADTFGKY